MAENDRSQMGRELIAAVISVVILVMSMVAFYSTFSSGGKSFTGVDAGALKEAYERQKDLLVIAMGMLGTVTGYYLGRVPAELRAKTATGLLDQATTVARQAEHQTDDVKREARAAAEAALAVLNETPLGADRANAARSPGDPERSLLARHDVEEARRRLTELLRRVS